MARPGRNLHGHVIDTLGRRIVGGDYAPGHTLDLAELADELAVSHTVLREALRALAEKRLIDARPRRGTFVRQRQEWNLLDRDVLTWRYETQTDMTLLHDLLEVRESLEPTAARLAAQRHTEADLGELSAALEQFRGADHVSGKVIAADLRFHRALFRAAHNEVLEQMELIVEIGLRARDRIAHSREGWHTTVEHHARIADAIADRDADRAEKATRILLQHSAASLEHDEA
ncbi:FadR/GntR family transcriptional regulator [Saccharopolyspora erythraea]|uniref:FadR/GntR family transcriptional regulator n=1 Tax=Saccharopolyspora erythraea TaxID=1836 RepID=UPI001BA76EBD|nr:FCD domain-containing protein [Saccharopolyspora erythraea]